MNKTLISLLPCLSLLATPLLADGDVPFPVVWSVSDGISAPESAYVDPASGFLFVSQIGEGGGMAKDGDGWISKLGTDGKVIKNKWVTGFDSPKGLRSHDGILWVTDIDSVVSIKIATGTILGKIRIPDATFLNDLAIAPDGSIYVSDMLKSRVVVIKEGKPSVFVEGPDYEHPNGLLVHKGKLVIAGWGKGLAEDFSTKTPGRLLSVDLKTQKLEPITPKPLGNLDGVESDANGGFLVTDWMAGTLLHVSASGSPTPLATFPQGAADLAYLPERQLVILPQMIENKLSAFKIGKTPPAKPQTNP